MKMLALVNAVLFITLAIFLISIRAFSSWEQYSDFAYFSLIMISFYISFVTGVIYNDKH